MALEETLALECHALARKTTIIILQSDRAERVSNVIEDGEMLAMIQAFSNDQVRWTLPVLVLSDTDARNRSHSL